MSGGCASIVELVLSLPNLRQPHKGGGETPADSRVMNTNSAFVPLRTLARVQRADETPMTANARCPHLAPFAPSTTHVTEGKSTTRITETQSNSITQCKAQTQHRYRKQTNNTPNVPGTNNNGATYHCQTIHDNTQHQPHTIHSHTHAYSTALHFIQEALSLITIRFPSKVLVLGCSTQECTTTTVTVAQQTRVSLTSPTTKLTLVR